jgi:hypothetical protein
MNAQTQATLRKKIDAYLDGLPPRQLSALKPILARMSVPESKIDTDLTEKEKRIIEDGLAEYRRNPDSFMSLDDYIKQRGLKA